MSNKIKILLVDKSEISNFCLKQDIEKLLPSSEVEKTNCVASAWKSLIDSLKSKDFFHVVICEYHMSEIKGTELLRRIRLHPYLKNTVFILMSKQSDKESVENFLKRGADNFIVKPFEDIEVLIKKIKDTILNKFGR